MRNLAHWFGFSEGGIVGWWHRDGLLRVMGRRFSVSDGIYRVAPSMGLALVAAILVKDRNGRGFISFSQGCLVPDKDVTR
jgi:hypothetical protein